MKRLTIASLLVLGCGGDTSDDGAVTPGSSGSSSAGSATSSADPGTGGVTTATTTATTGALDSSTGVDTSAGSQGESSSSGGTEVTCPPTGPADVGVVDEALLVDSDRIVVSESGTIIENVHVHGDIEIVDGATDITIRNFRITTDGYWGIFVRDGSNIVIEDGEIDGQDGIDDAIRGADYTARRLYIHDIGGDSFKADGGNVLECNYVTAIGQAPGAHGDGVQMMGDGDIEITANNFDLTSGELTACIFPFGTDPVSGPVHADGNRLVGGAYIVYCHENLHMTNNVFGDQYAYGPVTDTCGTWENNTWESSGEPVPN
ncbi:MAG: right-handed parallel beta-helix repeat-containing protein [Nannocystaceae bacterium]|nr:right-handed parallel beta-helix repeat-containing protein [Deltaproteobacteria bacterium]MBP7291035.1 right-handed parallel beta-helix repeat-containing protein [Nannocystaceae bacterium]